MGGNGTGLCNIASICTISFPEELCFIVLIYPGWRLPGGLQCPFCNKKYFKNDKIREASPPKKNHCKNVPLKGFGWESEGNCPPQVYPKAVQSVSEPTHHELGLAIFFMKSVLDKFAHTQWHFQFQNFTYNNVLFDQMELHIMAVQTCFGNLKFLKFLFLTLPSLN